MVRPVATWDDVRRIALGMPGSEERTSRGMAQWRVGDRLFVWERPLRRSDLAALGAAAPQGAILGARVPHEEVKHALIEEAPDVYFTIPHFDGYPAILVRLEQISASQLEELVVEAWLDRAPVRLAREFRESRP